MTDQTVTLRLQATNSGLLPPVREADKAVRGLGQSSVDAGRQSAAGAAGVARLGNAADGTARRANAMAGALNAAKAAIGAYASVQVLSGMVRMSDEYANITGRLKLATASQVEFEAAQAATYAISQRTSTSLESTASLYARLAQNTAEYGVTQQRQLALTETINRTFAVSGTSAVAAANTITQFTQALAGGVLRAEEFNSVVENSPRLAKALADGMGVGMGELRKQVNDGQVTVERMITALESQAGVIEREFSSIPLTVERAMVQLRNSVQLTVGQMSESFGVGNGIAAGVSVLANNMELLANALGIVAVAYAGRLVTGMGAAAVAKAQAILQTRQMALVELEAARTAEAAAAARLASARAGMGAAGSLVAAEASMAAATARTTAAVQASSLALTAKAAATRAAGVAMAAFGGPVGLAVTALTLFVMWAVNSKAKADELAKSVTAGFQDAINTLNGFDRATANADFAGMSTALEKVDQAAQSLQDKVDQYDALVRRAEQSTARFGVVGTGTAASLEELAKQIDVARNKHDQLSAAADANVQAYATLVLESAGVASASTSQRSTTEQLVRSLMSEGQTLDQVKPLLQEHVRVTYGVEAANRVAAASFDQVGNAAATSAAKIQEATKKMADGLNGQIATAELRLIEQTQGKAAAMRAGFVKALADEGIDPTSEQAAGLRQLNEQLIAVTLSSENYKAATKAVGAAESEAKRAAEERQRVLEQQLESQRRYANEAALAAAEMTGPLAVAEEERRQRIAELDAELAAHNITQAAYNTLIEATLELERRRAAEIAQDQAAPQALLDSMTGELYSLTLLGTARERHQRQLRAEADMRRAINDANKAGAGINAQVTASLVAQARAYADLSLVIEQQMSDLQELGDVLVRGVADGADLMADLFSGGIDSSKDFFDQLKDIFRQGWRDLLRTMMEQNFVRPFQDMLTNAITGAFNGAGGASGGWMSQLAGLIGGGNNLTGTSAMQAGGSWMTGALAVGSAAAPGSLMGFGNNMSAFTGGGGGGSSAMQLVDLGNGVMGFLKPGVSKAAVIGKFASSSAGMWSGAALGAMYGWKQGGDTAGKALGAAAYGTAGYFGMGALGAGATAMAGGAGLMGAGSAALGAIPVAGWVALAAIVVDKVSGGKLFGTKHKTKETGQTINIDAAGGSASAYAYQEGQKSLFRGKKRRTINVDASEESLAAADELYKLIQQTAKGASEALGLAAVDVISGSFKAVYDSKGNLKSELSTVLGRTFEETFEEFQQRLQAENIVAQVGQLDDTASAIAERWRSSAAELLDGAQFLLAAAADFNNGAGLLSVGGLSRLTDVIEALRMGSETMSQAYVRVMSTAQAYADVAASAQQEIATAGFSGFANSLLQVKQEEKERIRQLQAQAKALGGLSAREQDLAAVRQAAALKTDALATTLQGELVDLALNRLNDQIEQLGGAANGAGSKIEDFINGLRLSDSLSVDTDAAQRVTANDLMNAAALAGDADGFTQYAQQFLEISRNLNASAAGYQADYDRVMELARQFGTTGGSASLDELYAQRSALQAQQEAAARLERAQRIAQGVSDLAGVRGGDPLEILRSVTGMSADALAGDLGLSVGQLSQYLEDQQTDLGDLADILYDLPQRIASEMVVALADSVAPQGASAPSAPAGVSSSGSSTLGQVSDPAAVQALQRIEALLARQGAILELEMLR